MFETVYGVNCELANTATVCLQTASTHATLNRKKEKSEESTTAVVLRAENKERKSTQGSRYNPLSSMAPGTNGPTKEEALAVSMGCEHASRCVRLYSDTPMSEPIHLALSLSGISGSCVVAKGAYASECDSLPTTTCAKTIAIYGSGRPVDGSSSKRFKLEELPRS